MKLSIIIPVYNERRTILRILARVKAANTLGLAKEIIIVDDGSTDGSQLLISRFVKNYRDKESSSMEKTDFKIIEHQENQGKGAALQSGLKAATGDILLIQDADLEYNPQYYPKLLKLISNGKTKVVYGSRLKKMKLVLFGKEATPFPFHYLANRFLSWLTSLLFSTRISDMETGYKVMAKEVYNRLHLSSKRFECEPEITAKVLKMDYQILEVPIQTKPRSYQEGKKIDWRDGFKALWALIKFRFL